MEEWGSVMTSNIFSNGAARRIELLADVQRRLASSTESLEQVRSYAITMLHYACQAGDVAMVHLVLLLCRGVDVNGRNVWGGTPLHSLCRYGHLKAQALNMREIALMFVMHGADLELRDNYKKTAYDYAVQNQIFEVSDVLSAVAGSAPTSSEPRPMPVQTSPPRQFTPTSSVHHPTSSMPPPLPTHSSPYTPQSLPPVHSPLSPPPLPSSHSSIATSLPPVSSPQPVSSPLPDLHTPQLSNAHNPLHLQRNPLVSGPAPGLHQQEQAAPQREVYRPAPASAVTAQPQLSQHIPDIRDLGLDPGPGEKKKMKKKNNTIMRHVTMIQDAPKPPYGGGRTSRPSSGKQRQ